VGLGRLELPTYGLGNFSPRPQFVLADVVFLF
jgi:hypothetical protein